MSLQSMTWASPRWRHRRDSGGRGDSVRSRDDDTGAVGCVANANTGHAGIAAATVTAATAAACRACCFDYVVKLTILGDFDVRAETEE